MNNIYCPNAFKNLFVKNRKNNISTGLCCAHTAPNLDLIRNNFKLGIKDPACDYCWKTENQNIISRRQSDVQWYTDHNVVLDEIVDIKRLEIDVGDICNLACRTCGPEYSSKWKGSDASGKSDVTQLLSTIDLSNIIYIHFTGGETLATDVHIDVLNLIKNKSQVTLYYNTNGTFYPSQDIFNLWSKFKLVQITFSIDSIGERFNYLRWPAKWDEVYSIMKKFKDSSPPNMMFGINVTVSMYNIFYIQETIDWFNQEFPTNRISDKNDLSLSLAGPMGSIDARLNLTLQMKQEIKTRLDQKYHNLLNCGWNELQFKNFINSTRIFDQQRNQSFVQVFPEWANLLQSN